MPKLPNNNPHSGRKEPHMKAKWKKVQVGVVEEIYSCLVVRVPVDADEDVILALAEEKFLKGPNRYFSDVRERDFDIEGDPAEE